MPPLTNPTDLQKSYKVLHCKEKLNTYQENLRFFQKIDESLRNGDKHLIIRCHKKASADASFPSLLMKAILKVQEMKGSIEIIAEGVEMYNLLINAKIHLLIPVYGGNQEIRS